MSEDSSVIGREARDRAMKIGERFDHDLHESCKYLRKQERRHPERIVSQIVLFSQRSCVFPFRRLSRRENWDSLHEPLRGKHHPPTRPGIPLTRGRL